MVEKEDKLIDAMFSGIVGVMIVGSIANMFRPASGYNLVAGYNDNVVYGGKTLPVEEAIADIIPYITPNAAFWVNREEIWYAYVPHAPEESNLFTLFHNDVCFVEMAQAYAWQWIM